MTIFQAKIPLLNGAVAPDEYNPSKGRTPPDDFVVTRARDGSPLSLYGQLIWDRTPYDPEERTANLHFDFWTEGELTPQRDQLVREMQWLMFVLIYLRPGHGLSNGTLRNYLKVFHALARFSETRSMRIQDVLGNPIHVIESLDGKMNLCHELACLINLLKDLGRDVVGFEVVNSKVINKLYELKRAWSNDSKQHPPIPTRIYSAILSSLSLELEAFECVADRVLELFNECTKDQLSGRSFDDQKLTIRRLKLENETRRPEFPDLLVKYDLEEYWAKKGYTKSVKGLSICLTEILRTCSIQIQAYTGMRANEVGALPHYCLELVERDGSIHYIVKGRVTKHAHGRIKRVQWVTSESGRRAILLAQRITRAIYKARGEVPNDSITRINSHFLFISPRFGFRESKNVPYIRDLCLYPRLKALLQPTIREEDVLELEQIDPHRAWRSEAAFQIGQPWTFTSHQLRRSLALYAQRSGLVSLPSLKRQLQHITQEMATYYCRGSAFALDFIGDGHKEKHFGEEWQEAQPVSQFLSYAAHVLLTDGTLFGVHPHWVKQRLLDSEGIVVFDREVTLKRFKKGELSYRETVLGGCVKVGECDKNPLDLLEVGCLSTHCKNLVGSQKKLERVIAVQSNAVNRLKQIDPKSPEYHHEKANLGVLKKTLENVLSSARAPEEAA